MVALQRTDPLQCFRCWRQQEGLLTFCSEKKIIDEFVIIPNPDNPSDRNEDTSPENEDFIRNYSLCHLKYYFIFVDIKDEVKERNGERLVILYNIYCLVSRRNQDLMRMQ